jgi:beta-glucosidase
LSYTTFSYTDLKVDSRKLRESIKLTLRVTNKGSTLGKEVVQLYISAPGNAMDKPVRELKKFAKTKLLKPQETELLTFFITADDLASFNVNKSSWVVEPGKYELQIGASSKNIKLVKEIIVEKDIVTEKVNAVLNPQVLLVPGFKKY